MNLFRPYVSRVVALALFVAIQSNTGLAQKRPRNDLTILERNIRAEMNFLASDAMQGRGSSSTLGGRVQRRWRGQVIEYSEPSRLDRVRAWFRGKGRR